MAKDLQAELDKEPDKISLRLSVSEAYQRVGDHFKFIDENEIRLL
jgi:hypothetical protein